MEFPVTALKWMVLFSKLNLAKQINVVILSLIVSRISVFICYIIYQLVTLIYFVVICVYQIGTQNLPVLSW